MNLIKIKTPTPNLEPAKNILRLFFREIKELQKCISEPVSPPFSIKDREPYLTNVEFTSHPDLACENENAYRWLYAEAKHYHARGQA
ncbi:MAG: hypothetical protein WC222_04640 [Parachlamydiales bacterium]|jgi:hypothetical protein